MDADLETLDSYHLLHVAVCEMGTAIVPTAQMREWRHRDAE